MNTTDYCGYVALGYLSIFAFFASAMAADLTPPPPPVVVVKPVVHVAKLRKDSVIVTITCTASSCKAVNPSNGRKLELGKGGSENFERHIKSAKAHGWTVAS